MSEHWKPFDPITEIEVDVPKGVHWPAGYEPKESYALPARAGKFYQSARVKVREVRPAMTAEQAAYNAEHKPCGRCHGRGATRKDQAVGCPVCNGTGVAHV